jgi:hypothetical protein
MLCCVAHRTTITSRACVRVYLTSAELERKREEAERFEWAHAHSRARPQRAVPPKRSRTSWRCSATEERRIRPVASIVPRAAQGACVLVQCVLSVVGGWWLCFRPGVWRRNHCARPHSTAADVATLCRAPQPSLDVQTATRFLPCCRHSRP